MNKKNNFEVVCERRIEEKQIFRGIVKFILSETKGLEGKIINSIMFNVISYYFQCLLEINDHRYNVVEYFDNFMKDIRKELVFKIKEHNDENKNIVN